MDSKFLPPYEHLDLRQVGWTEGKPIWQTLARLDYQSEGLDVTITIPEGFRTDLASVPRWFFTWLIAGGKAPRPAVIHDYAYQFGYFTLVDGTCLQVTKKETDDLFVEAMKVDEWSGTNWITRHLMWMSVRVGGRGVWASTIRPEVIEAASVVKPEIPMEAQ